ncbi:hypothetical protein Y032_0664g1310 [Ancylostoma ceylanicum]|uniref:Protein YIPF n=1 Tax=Ancylostoma ceylanicum TaxID=53326 RepID=A0A016WI36_9BILA|nr:hypothetical protein Y032_0664g1310 [Ancylostoma ceylanicum]
MSNLWMDDGQQDAWYGQGQGASQAGMAWGQFDYSQQQAPNQQYSNADKSISFVCTASVLGYCLLPMALLSMITAVLSFKGIFGYSVSALAVMWCSSASSKLFVIALSMHHQRLLVAYPCVLLYSVFALLAIF